MAALLPFLTFLVEHLDLIATIYDAITTGKTKKDQVTQAVQDAIWAASDAEMKREFPRG